MLNGIPFLQEGTGVYIPKTQGGHRDIVKERCLSEETQNQARKHEIKESLTHAAIYLSHVEDQKRKEIPLNRSKQVKKKSCGVIFGNKACKLPGFEQEM